MTTHIKPRLTPIQAPGVHAQIKVRQQLDMLRWALPEPFTLRDLSRCIASRVPPGVEKRAGALAEATIQAWMDSGYITGAGTRDGLPAYQRGGS